VSDHFANGVDAEPPQGRFFRPPYSCGVPLVSLPLSFAFNQTQKVGTVRPGGDSLLISQAAQAPIGTAAGAWYSLSPVD